MNHFIDNAAALAGLAKNTSSTEDSVKIIHSFSLGARGAALQIDVWFEYLAPKANMADRPWRNDFSFVVDTFGSELVTTVLPKVTSWGSVESALAAPPEPRRRLSCPLLHSSGARASNAHHKGLET